MAIAQSNMGDGNRAPKESIRRLRRLRRFGFAFSAICVICVICGHLLCGATQLFDQDEKHKNLLAKLEKLEPELVTS